MKINKDIFIRLADMAKLDFSEKEEKQLINDINKTIEYIDTMNEQDTEDIEPFICSRQVKNAFREDMAANFEAKEILLSGGPDVSDGYYVVPKTIE